MKSSKSLKPKRKSNVFWKKTKTIWRKHKIVIYFEHQKIVKCTNQKKSWSEPKYGSCSFDIDGVLAGWNYFKKPYLDAVDPKKIELINTVDAKIVISSSWGEDGGKTEKVLRRNGLRLEIVGYTEHFWNNWICRGNEIAKWIEDNVKDTDDFEYCIVDDDTDMLLSQKDNFVHVNERYGITKRDIEKIKKILERR